MRLTTRTNLAVRGLMVCAAHCDRRVISAEIARKCNCFAHHLARVVRKLQANGIVVTARGRAGGVRIGRPVERASIGVVAGLFEAGIPPGECFSPVSNTCPLVEVFRLRRDLVRALDAFRHELDRITLEDLVQRSCGLADSLSMTPQAPGPCPRPSRLVDPAA